MASIPNREIDKPIHVMDFRVGDFSEGLITVDEVASSAVCVIEDQYGRTRGKVPKFVEPHISSEPMTQVGGYVMNSDGRASRQGCAYDGQSPKQAPVFRQPAR